MTFIEQMPAKTRFVVVTFFILALCLFLLVHSILTAAPQLSSVDARPLYSRDATSSAQEIEITTSEEVYTLARSGDAWTLREKAGFPARQDSVAELLNALQVLAPAARSTALPERHAGIGVTDPDQGGFGAAIRIDAQDDIFIFGRKGAAQYGRLRGEDQAWRLNQVLPPLYNPLRWMSLGDDTLPRPQDDVTAMSIQGGGQTAAILRDGENWVTDQGEAVSDATIDAAIFTSRMLEFEDVRREGLTRAYYTIYFNYADDRMQAIELLQDNDAVWVRFRFEGFGEEMQLYAGREFRIDELSALDLAPEL
ncbi:DUF4340 domain-containing protein [Ponticaulis sp.]|uniref:DUF4340 domain-containing protein n=1 Tax=Ponticaulis sp. TaxID=2020902 RepID=UPI0025FC0831|nr:DUF4340 domain-containing protein [Ponticaulis sp.]|tara:strand:- start:13053 stop:13979 length:927 start_codon:yes stop_codon:yes gene_type:complete